VEFCDSGEGIPNIDFLLVTKPLSGVAISNSAVSEETKIYNLGGKHQFRDRPIQHHFFAFPVDVPGNSSTSIITRIQGDSVRIPFMVHSPDAFTQDAARANLFMGIMYGILLVMTLYNTTIFAVLRDKNYAYYVGFVIFLMAVLMPIDGFSAQYVFPNIPTINLHLVNVGSSLCCAFLLLFCLSFLNTKEHYPKTFFAIRSVIALTLINGFANIFIKFNLATNIIVSITLFCTVALGVLSIRKTPKLAFLFLVPFSFFAAGAALTVLKQAAVLPANMLTTEGLRIGVAVNISLWSQALAYRLRYLLEEKFKAECLLAEGQKRESSAKIQALKKNLQLVAQVSDKLNSPLLSIMHMSSKMKRITAEPKCNLEKKQCSQETPCAFFTEINAHVANLEIAAECLSELSTTLSEMREEQGNVEPTTLIAHS